MLRNRFTKFGLLLLLSAATTIAIAAPPPGKGGGGKNNASLSVSVTPESFSERDAGATGTVTRVNSDTSVALTVTLESSNPDQATVLGIAGRVPPSVDIQPGEVSAEFQVAAVDDTVKDGDQLVTISVSATDHSGASASITVVDDEGLPSVEYQSVAISLPSTDSIYLNDFNDSAQACGRFGTPRSGWIYSPVLANHPVDTVVDVNTLNIEGLNAGWVIRNCVGISNNGLVVGQVSPVDDASETAWRGYVLDISVTPAQFYELPDDAYSWDSTFARKVNDNGDILGTFQVGGMVGSYLYNPGLRSGDPEIELEVLDFIDTRAIKGSLNNPPVGVASTIIGSTDVSDSGIVVYPRGSTPYYLPEGIGSEGAVNDFGGIAGRGAIEVPINKKKTESVQVIYRDYVTEDYFEGYYGRLESLNNSGTMLMRSSTGSTLFHDDYGFIDVASITSQGPFLDNTSLTTSARMNNVGPDGFGAIAILKDPEILPEFYILTPVELAP